MYDQFVPGEAVLGEHPDRALYEYANANRRQRDVAERFVGRIRAQAADGSPVELGGGELYLPPALPAPAPPSWSTPGAPPGWPTAYGGGGPPSWGGPPPWWGAGGPPGMPPWWGATGAPLSALLAAAQPPQPPAAVQQDPASLHMWKGMQEANMMLLKAVVERAAAPASAPAAAAAPADPLDQLLKYVAIFDKLKGPPPEQSHGINVIKVDDDTTLVTNKHGDIDPGATAWSNLKAVKGIVSSLRSIRPPTPGVTGGPQPPRRAGLPAANGAAKPNGAS